MKKIRIVTKLNILQGVHSLFAPITQKYFFGSCGRMVWRKLNELIDVVNDIRVWIETIKSKTDLIRQLLRNSSMDLTVLFIGLIIILMQIFH